MVVVIAEREREDKGGGIYVCMVVPTSTSVEGLTKEALFIELGE